MITPACCGLSTGEFGLDLDIRLIGYDIPLISYWRINFRRSKFHISYWEKISENLTDLQRGDPLQKLIRPSNYSEIWDDNFRIVTGSKLARESVS